MENRMKNKVILFPNMQSKWKTKIFEIFMHQGDVATLYEIERFHRLHGEKNIFLLLASLCYYHLGEQEEGEYILQKLLCQKKLAPRKELYALFVFISKDVDFWAWRQWCMKFCYKEAKGSCLQSWLEEFQPARYQLLSESLEQKKSFSTFVQRFLHVFHDNNDFETQLVWLQGQEEWEKSKAFVKACQVFLSNSDAHPLIQTLLLQQLKFENIDAHFLVCKNGHAKPIDLSKIDYPFHSFHERQMIHKIQSYEKNDVTYAEQMLKIYQQYIMVHYPFIPKYSEAFFQALILYTDSLFGKTIDLQYCTEEEKQVFSSLSQANVSIFCMD